MATPLYYRPNRSNFVAEEPGTITGAALDWTAEIPAGNLTPPVVNDIGTRIYVVSGQNRIHSIEAKTGEGRWRSQILGDASVDDREVLTPFIAANKGPSHLYATVLHKQNREITGSLLVLDTDDGDIIAELSDESYLTEPVGISDDGTYLTHPEGVIDLDDQLFVGTQGWVVSRRTDQKYHLEYDLITEPTGEDTHGFPTYNDLSESLNRNRMSTHLAAEDSSVFAVADNSLFVYDINQRETEVKEFGNPDASYTYIHPNVAVWEDSIFIPLSGDSRDETPNQLIAYDYEGGLNEWSFEVDFTIQGLATNGEYVFCGKDRELIAIDCAEGTQVWSREVDTIGREPGEKPLPKHPAVTDSTIFTHYENGESEYGLLALNASDGSERWRVEYDHDDKPVSYPVFTSSHIIYKTEKGRLCGLKYEIDEDTAEGDDKAASEPGEPSDTEQPDSASSQVKTKNSGSQNPEKIQCPNCGATHASTANYCSDCGEELSMLQCPGCESEVDPADSFCSNCGTNLE
jgi:outer membrane protein assembly factor BamB